MPKEIWTKIEFEATKLAGLNASRDKDQFFMSPKTSENECIAVYLHVHKTFILNWLLGLYLSPIMLMLEKGWKTPVSNNQLAVWKLIILIVVDIFLRSFVGIIDHLCSTDPYWVEMLFIVFYICCYLLSFTYFMHFSDRKDMFGFHFFCHHFTTSSRTNLQVSNFYETSHVGSLELAVAQGGLKNDPWPHSCH